MAEKVLKTRIQLIRGFTSKFESDNPITLHGEFYVCENPSTHVLQFKIGQKDKRFNELKYYEDDLLETLGIKVDPDTIGDGQVLVFNGVTGKWENEKFADGKTVTYDPEKGLHITGYYDETVPYGYYPVKDLEKGIKWNKPLDRSELDAAVQLARDAATAAGQARDAAATYATEAGTQAVEASKSAAIAAKQVEIIQEWVGKKFWWGTLEEYNALEEIYEGTFYFVRM